MGAGPYGCRTRDWPNDRTGRSSGRDHSPFNGGAWAALRYLLHHHRPKRSSNVSVELWGFHALPMPSELLRLKPLIRSTSPSCKLSGYSEPAESLGFTRTISILGKLAGALFGVVFCNSFGAFVLSRDVGSSADAKGPTSRAAATNIACCLMIHLCRPSPRETSANSSSSRSGR
jgi:hypothetical protein